MRQRHPIQLTMPAPLCRCCMQPIDCFWQQNFYDNGGKFFVHCESPDCPLYFATREIHDWLTMDLRQWKAEQHPCWTAPEHLPEVA
jgi:hypothetical protein